MSGTGCIPAGVAGVRDRPRAVELAVVDHPAGERLEVAPVRAPLSDHVLDSVNNPAVVEIAARGDAAALRWAARAGDPWLPHGARLQHVARLARGRRHWVEVGHLAEVRIAPEQRLVVPGRNRSSQPGGSSA